MTRADIDILRMAREAGMTSLSLIDVGYLERFAALVAKHEREACAQVAEWEPCMTHSPQRIAAAIRARGETK